MMGNINRKREVNLNKRRGFSLFEMLLTVGIAAIFFVFLFNIGQTIARNQAVKAAAAYVKDLESAVQVMLQDPSRYNTLYNAVLASGGVAQASIDDLKTGSGILAALPENPLLNSAFPILGPFRQTYVVIFRVPIPVTGTRVLETYIASQTKLDDELVTRIAGTIGGTGGALRDSSSVVGATIRGTYGGWTAATNNLAITPWFVNIAAQTPPTVQNGGYVVSYNYNDSARVARDYLYRTNTGDPTHNTMFTDLSLGSYNVVGANTVTTTGALTANEIVVEGNASLANAPTIAGSLQSDDALTVGNISAAAGSGVQMTINNGETIVNNTTSATRSVFSTGLTTSSHTATSLTTENANVNVTNFDASATSGINASGGLSVSGNVAVGAQTQAGIINTNNLTANNGEVATIGLEVTGDLDQISGTTQVNEFGGAGLTRSSTSNWPCGNGC